MKGMWFCVQGMCTGTDGIAPGNSMPSLVFCVLYTAVCSPGGTTIHGIHALEKAGLQGSLLSAVKAATALTPLRAKKLRDNVSYV